MKTSLLCEYCACGPKLAGCEKGMVIDMGKHADSLKEESKFFLTDTDTGLTSEQVHERMESGLSNAVTGRASRATGRIIASNIFTYFNLIFFFLAAVLLYERSYNNLAFLGVVAANTVIGIVQELRSKKELEKLQLVNEPDALVIRDAKQKRILIEELVQDDIVLLAAGNQICADAVLCEGTLRVNEALVTGEADEVVKTSGDTLLSGSFVVSGQAKVRLTRVGDQSFSANISKSAKKNKKTSTPRYDDVAYQTDSDDWDYHYPLCSTDVLEPTFCTWIFRKSKCGKHSGCHNWYDSGGALPFDQYCACGQHGPSCTKTYFST